MTLLRVLLFAMCAHVAIAFAPLCTLPCSVSLRAAQRPSALSLRAAKSPKNLPFSRRAISFWAAGALAAASFPTHPATAADLDALRGELVTLIQADPGILSRSPRPFLCGQPCPPPPLIPTTKSMAWMPIARFHF